jgi:ergothioneine biosynthesis protein EgtB
MTIHLELPSMDAVQMRAAGRDLLSLALMDARNQTLRWMTALEQVLASPVLKVPLHAEVNPPLWTIGRNAWFQEHWISRNVQRQRGRRADPSSTRLASIEPMADGWFDVSLVPHDARWLINLPDGLAMRQYLFDTLETTLELLGNVAEDDDALYFFRLALFHEDAQRETLAVLAQTLGLNPSAVLPRMEQSAASRDPLHFAAANWQLGSEDGGFVFDNERAAHVVALREYEIDAQPVSWAQYAEFVEDGGYDESRWWSEDGWAWLQREGRRCPRHVEQMRHGVLTRRFGLSVRVPLQQPVIHVSWHEAQAWCRWAGRRLPFEAEWEQAAMNGVSRGFRWGQVWEWTAEGFHHYPGYEAGPLETAAPLGHHKVLRGASFATSDRLRHPKVRHPLSPQRDDLFTGFRSCAI